MGDVQGHPYRQNLGDVEGALQSHRKALAIRERLWQENPTDTQTIQAMARSSFMTGAVLVNTDKVSEGMRLLTRGRELMEDLADSDPHFKRIKLVSFYTDESHWLILQGDYEAAHVNLRKALAIADAAPQKHRRQYRVYEEMSELMANTGDVEAALRWQQRAHELLDHIPYSRHRAARSHSRMAKRLAAVDKTEQALEYAQIALKMRQSFVEVFPADIRARHKLAGAYLDLARLHNLMATRADNHTTQAQ